MSTVKANNHQVGQSATANQNFTLYQPATPDGTVRLGVGNSGATTADALIVDSSSNLRFNSGYGSAATAYGCRAWVNFNGTGTVAIRASGNVSSITDNGVGNYAVNLTTAMPDANYSVSATKGYNSGAATGGRGCEANPSTSSVANVYSYFGGALGDDAVINVAIFR